MLGLNYFGQSGATRRKFKRILHWHATLLSPTLFLLGRMSRVKLADSIFLCEGVPGPKEICSPESFRAAIDYQPCEADLFVATQMRCGTTLTQHLLYQILTRGEGDLVAKDQTLYAVSPWIESVKTVSMDGAPLIGSPPGRRIIKTHLPAQLCPFDPSAKYVYVTRNPVSCFSSCVDFIRHNLGVFAPELAEFETWFQDERQMWWGTWPAHVAGWLQRAQTNDNVLVLQFEEMKTDLDRVIARVAEFLEIAPLNESERESVRAHCSFEFMKTHRSTFEMSPPHLLQEGTGVFLSGEVDRQKKLPDDERERITAWCKQEIRAAGPPLSEMYAELGPSEASS